MSKITGKQKNKSGGFKVFWIPTSRKNHKHKSNKYYPRDNHSPEDAMMSGDSPNSHSKEFFDFKEGRSTPPPTTSKEVAVQSNNVGKDIKNEAATISVLAEPLKEHGPTTNFVGILDPRCDLKSDDDIVGVEDKALKNDDCHQSGEKESTNNDFTKKVNGTVDLLDGKWVAPADVKKEDEEQDDNCTVKCLYYTLQCCECTIM